MIPGAPDDVLRCLFSCSCVTSSLMRLLLTVSLPAVTVSTCSSSAWPLRSRTCTEKWISLVRVWTRVCASGFLICPCQPSHVILNPECYKRPHVAKVNVEFRCVVCVYTPRGGALFFHGGAAGNVKLISNCESFSCQLPLGTLSSSQSQKCD